MPNLVAPDLKISSAKTKRLQFRYVRIGQLFYSNYRWYKRVSVRKGLRADAATNETVWFKQVTVVRIFYEDALSQREKNGMSFQEFMNQDLT